MVCHWPGGASNTCFEKLTHLVKSSAGVGSCKTTWPLGPSVEKILSEALSVSLTVPLLRTRKSVETVEPGLAFNSIGNGEISTFKPWEFGMVWARARGVNSPTTITGKHIKTKKTFLIILNGSG